MKAQVVSTTPSSASSVALGGINPGALDTLEALLVQVESLVAGFPTVSAVERRRFRINAVGDADFGSRIGELSTQDSGADTALAVDPSLLAQRAQLRDRCHAQLLRLTAVQGRLKTADALLARQHNATLSAAYASLKVIARTATPEFRAQVERAGRRFQRVKKKKKDGTGNGTGSGPGAGNGAGGSTMGSGSTPGAGVVVVGAGNGGSGSGSAVNNPAHG